MGARGGLHRKGKSGNGGCIRVHKHRDTVHCTVLITGSTV